MCIVVVSLLFVCLFVCLFACLFVLVFVSRLTPQRLVTHIFVIFVYEFFCACSSHPPYKLRQAFM